RIYARVLQNGTPLRGNPDNMGYPQTILDEGKVVYIFQSQIAADGMTWYLVQYSGQWGFVRADLVRLMGEEETNEYLASLEAEMATPTPMPQVTPEPVGPESTSAYAKLIKDAVNLRRTPSTSGTSLGRIARDTLLLVLGEEDDGTYTWYQVDYNGETGYVRSDMAKVLTIAELQEYLASQTQTTPAPNAGVSTTPNSSNNVSHVIGGTPLKDLIPVDDSWTNNIISGMPSYATASPDPNATPSPVPVSNPASLISSFGTLTVNGVPAVTTSGEFEVYGKTAPYTAVKATVDVTVETQTVGSAGIIASAIAESSETRKYTVGETVSDANGDYTMKVRLPQAGEYIVDFTSGTSYARYGVTFDASANATPEPTAAPLPTMEPVKEEGGFGLMPILIGGLLIVVAAIVYGVYIYLRRKEEEEEEEAEDEEEELLRERMNQQRIRRAQQTERPTAAPGANAAPRMPQNQAGQVPSYMRNTPTAPKAPTMPQAPAAPKAPTMPQAPVVPQAPAAKPESPYARPVTPAAPTTPAAPVAPVAPVKPQAPAMPAESAETGEQAPRRRRRPPVDPNA
ncbi:MAG: SH3 domain-containing protein, partial [Clostridia bacterium]|nr:SH3 domain-containing protein [Clostridia bacterium]